VIQLGVATVRFRYPTVTNEELRRLSVSIYEAATETVRRGPTFGDMQIVLDVEEGSIRARSKLLVTAIAVGMFLEHYGGIREGAEYLARDVMTVGSWIIDRVVQEAGVSHEGIISSRRSATLARRIRGIIAKVESGELTGDVATRRITELLDPDGEGAIPTSLVDTSLVDRVVADASRTSERRRPHESTAPQIHIPLQIIEEYSDDSRVTALINAQPLERPRKPRHVRIYTDLDGRLHVVED
jgi:hypothetical protein